MNEQRWLERSERWLRILLRLYPVDFRDEMGEAVVNTYRERCHNTLRTRGALALMRIWLRALWDSLRNGIGERVRPAASWRRSGNWGRDEKSSREEQRLCERHQCASCCPVFIHRMTMGGSCPLHAAAGDR